MYVYGIARNMQFPTYTTQYASHLASQNQTFQQKLSALSSPTDVGLVLDLILEVPEYDFGAGAWFLSTICGGDVRRGLQEGSPSEDGWRGFLTGCVGVVPAADWEERGRYWGVAKEVLGVAVGS